MTTTTDYGTTISCFPDLAPVGVLISGIQVVAEALGRRIITPRGRLLDDPNYGTDICGALGDDVDTATVNRYAAQMDREFRKDQRVTASSTTATFTNGALVTSSSITLAGGVTFTLVLSVTNVTVQILSTQLLS